MASKHDKKKTKDRKAFGLVIRIKRFQLEITQEELSEKADMHPTYLSSIERGERNPTLEKILSLARAFKCSPKDLMPDE